MLLKPRNLFCITKLRPKVHFKALCRFRITSEFLEFYYKYTISRSLSLLLVLYLSFSALSSELSLFPLCLPKLKALAFLHHQKLSFTCFLYYPFSAISSFIKCHFVYIVILFQLFIFLLLLRILLRTHVYCHYDTCHGTCACLAACLRYSSIRAKVDLSFQLV